MYLKHQQEICKKLHAIIDKIDEARYDAEAKVQKSDKEVRRNPQSDFMQHYRQIFISLQKYLCFVVFIMQPSLNHGAFQFEIKASQEWVGEHYTWC